MIIVFDTLISNLNVVVVIIIDISHLWLVSDFGKSNQTCTSREHFFVFSLLFI